MKYTKELLAPIITQNISVAGVLRDLGLKTTGGSHSYITRAIQRLGLDTRHFKGQGANAGASHKGGCRKLHWTEILTNDPSRNRRVASYRLRRALIELGRPYKCAFCGLVPVWQGKELRIQIEHQNGDWKDNRPKNLLFLCPNCHSQTESNTSNCLGRTSITTTKRKTRSRCKKENA